MSRARDIADLSSVTARLDTVGASSGALSNRNMIINGAMNVAQRGTSAVTIADATQYRVDRFNAYDNTSGAFTYEQSTTTPSGEGFINSTKLTVTSADTSIAAGEYAYYAQYIEGTNFSQCDFGNSGAKSVTLSFFVRSSATGTYCVTLANSASNRSFVSEYTISSANTWEKKTITVAGDTTGTWLTTTGIGLKVFFCLAVGSTYQQSAGSWGTTSFAFGSSNQTNWLGTNGNTLYITGVQLEVGDTATPFEHPRSVGDELQRCQRYYNQIQKGAWGVASAGGTPVFHFFPPVEMRVAPSYSLTVNKVAMGDMLTQGFDLTGATISANNHNTSSVCVWYFTASSFSATMTNFRPLLLESGGSFNGEVQMSAEL